MSRPTAQAPFEDDPLNPKVAASAFDLLLIELVPLAQRVTEQLLAREQALKEEWKRSRLFNRTASKTPVGYGQREEEQGKGGSGKEGVYSEGRDKEAEDGQHEVTSLGFPVMSEETRESVLWRLDGMGYRVGQGLVER